MFNENISMQLTPAAVRNVRAGHPWVFDNAVTKQNKDGEAGCLAVMHDKNRKFVGLGLYDPHSPIRVRVLHRGKPRNLDMEWFKDRFEGAFSRRETLMGDRLTNGYRLVHGENDALPGIVLDRFGDTFTLKLDTAGWLPHLDAIIEIITETLTPERIVLRMSRNVAEHTDIPDGSVYGEPLDGPVLFLENGITFEADPVKGQKTGFFLDQRENRKYVEKLAQGKDVLNVFAYNGGFSLYAIRGGAKRAISLDISEPALEAAKRNFKLNPDIPAKNHETVCADAFDYLASDKQRYGMVVLDPPSFAQKKDDVEGAIKAYDRLIQLGAHSVKPGGILVCASCSSRVDEETFFETAFKAVKKTGRTFSEIDRTFHSKDHPIGFREGAYLKCLYLTIT